MTPQDPHNQTETVILVHSLVEEGTAARDSRLKVGDRLLHVNYVSIYNQTLEFAVEQLKSVPLGSVAVIGVNHPLPVSPDVSSNPCSPLSRQSLLSEGEGEGYGEMMVDCFGEGTQSTVVGSMELRHTRDVSYVCENWVLGERVRKTTRGEGRMGGSGERKGGRYGEGGRGG